MSNPRHGRRRATTAPKSPAVQQQRGRRRAQPAPSTLAALADAASRSSVRITAVAAAGVLLGGAAMATGTSGTPTTTAQVNAAPQATSAPSAVSAPSQASVQYNQVLVSARSKSTGKNSDGVDAESSASKVKAIDDPATAQAFAASKLGDYGWGQDQMTCLLPLWNRESGWRTSAENPSSLAYGIAQSLPAEKMASVGADYRTNHETQIIWGLQYIKGRYGSPCSAWAHSNATGWY